VATIKTITPIVSKSPASAPGRAPANSAASDLCRVGSSVGRAIQNSDLCGDFAVGGGAGGIRTLDRALQPYNGLANRRLQPLGHSSVTADMPDAAACRKRQISGCRISGHLKVSRLDWARIDRCRLASGVQFRSSSVPAPMCCAQNAAPIRTRAAPAGSRISVCAPILAWARIGSRDRLVLRHVEIVPVKIGSTPREALASHHRDSFRACERRAFCDFVGVGRNPAPGNNPKQVAADSCADRIATALEAK
jgi:hypothetical protein